MQPPHSESFPNSPQRDSFALERELTRQIEQILRSDFSFASYLSVTFPFEGVDPFKILQSGLVKGPHFYWDQPHLDQAHLALGILKRFRATGEKRFENMTSYVEDVRSKVFSINRSDLPESQIPLFSGGYSFEPYNVSKEWREFGSAQFNLPTVIFTKRESFYTITLNLDLESLYLDCNLENRSSQENRLPQEKIAGKIREIFQELNLYTLLGSLRQLHSPLSSKKSESSHLPSRDDRSKRLNELRNMEGKTVWMQRVRKAIESIQARHFEKIVLAREVTLTVEDEFSSLPMLELLRNEFPECTLFHVEMESGKRFFGASPERLVKVQNQDLDTDALAGSAPRGMDESSDRRFASELIQSQKDQTEHQFVLREIIESLDDFSSNIVHTTTPGIRKLKNVQHLHTPIRATLDHDVSLHDIIGKLHPTPAVGGYPVKSALPYIHELEKLDRGWYSGAVGWFNLSGDGEFAVAIRSAFIESERLHLYAGCGIVEHSEPEKEWEETCMKLEPLYVASQIALERNSPEI